MQFLITNDDGISAPGLRALTELAEQFGTPKVVAPVHELSGCSHTVTTKRPIRMYSHGGAQVAIEGTPVDCVRLGLQHLAPEATWVLSGINPGGNLGADIHISGTVAAIREGVLRGVPGIAISHYKRKGFQIDWEIVKQWVAPVLQELLARSHKPGTFWNINLPSVKTPKPEIIYCPVDPHPLPADFHIDGETFHYKGNYHERLRESGSDVDVCFAGNIAVSCVRLYCGSCAEQE